MAHAKCIFITCIRLNNSFGYVYQPWKCHWLRSKPNATHQIESIHFFFALCEQQKKWKVKKRPHEKWWQKQRTTNCNSNWLSSGHNLLEQFWVEASCSGRLHFELLRLVNSKQQCNKINQNYCDTHRHTPICIRNIHSMRSTLMFSHAIRVICINRYCKWEVKEGSRTNYLSKPITYDNLRLTKNETVICAKLAIARMTPLKRNSHICCCSKSIDI